MLSVLLSSLIGQKTEGGQILLGFSIIELVMELFALSIVLLSLIGSK